jgi:Fic family protein
VWQHLGNSGVNDRQRTIMNRLLDGFEGHLTTSKYAKIAHCSSDTALRDIQELIECGVLLRNPAKGRSVSYRIAEDMSNHSEPF